MAENEETTEVERDPEALGFIPGKTRENAVRALAAADAADIAQWRVRAVHDGFEAPNAVVDKYEELLAEEAAEAVAVAELEAREAAKAADSGGGSEAAGDEGSTAGSEPDKPDEELPSDSPEWTVKRLDAYAETHGVELAKGLNKSDKLAAILAAVNKEK